MLKVEEECGDFLCLEGRFPLGLKPAFFFLSNWVWDSPSVFAGPRGAGLWLNLRKGSRLTLGGRLGFRGRGPSGGRGLLSGVTSPGGLCWSCRLNGGGAEEAEVRAEGWGGPGARLRMGNLGLICRMSPICFTFLEFGLGRLGLAPLGCGDHWGGLALAGMEVAGGSGLGRRPGPGEAIVGDGEVG